HFYHIPPERSGARRNAAGRRPAVGGDRARGRVPVLRGVRNGIPRRSGPGRRGRERGRDRRPARRAGGQRPAPGPGPRRDGKAELLAGLGVGQLPRVLVLDGTALADRTGPVETAPAVARAGSLGGRLDGSGYSGITSSGITPGLEFFGVRDLAGTITLPLS